MENYDVNELIDEVMKGVTDIENCDDVITRDWVDPEWMPKDFAAELKRPPVESGQGENSVIAANDGGELGDTVLENSVADGHDSSPEFAGATQEANQEEIVPKATDEIPDEGEKKNGESGLKRKRTAEEKVDTNSAVALPKESLAGISGHSLIAHVLTVPQGEDVLNMIQSVMGHGNICIRSAIGSIRNPSIFQPASRSILRFEGHFQIISLSGLYLHTGGRPSGGLSVSFSNTSGTITGGAVCGPLIAAWPAVQVLLLTFPINDSTSHQSSRNDDYDQPPD